MRQDWSSSSHLMLKMNITSDPIITYIFYHSRYLSAVAGKAQVNTWWAAARFLLRQISQSQMSAVKKISGPQRVREGESNLFQPLGSGSFDFLRFPQSVGLSCRLKPLSLSGSPQAPRSPRVRDEGEHSWGTSPCQSHTEGRHLSLWGSDITLHLYLNLAPPGEEAKTLASCLF